MKSLNSFEVRLRSYLVTGEDFFLGIESMVDRLSSVCQGVRIGRVIFVNFKAYFEGTGERAVLLAEMCGQVSGEIPVIPVVQAVDLFRVKQKVGKAEVWVENVDGVEFGQHTGAVLPEAVVKAGAGGTFLNHSEHKAANLEELGGTVKRCRSVGLKVLVFAADLGELSKVLPLRPDFVAYEPPALIGSKDRSVADQPEIIAEGAEMAKQQGISLLSGAGIHSPQDVRASLVGGAVGVVVARDILEAADPKQELLRLLEGFTHPGVEMGT